MKKIYNKTLSLAIDCHPLILEGIRTNQPQLCRVGDSKDHMHEFAHIVWHKDDEYPHCAIDTRGEVDEYKFAIPVKVVRKPRSFSEIRPLLISENYEVSQDGSWYDSKHTGNHPAFITEMIKCCEENTCDTFRWRDEWVTEEYEDITD